MKADLSRDTFDKRKHYSGVRMQQGRVQLDADWNEQCDIFRHRVGTETIDTVGPCGGSMASAGFHVVAAAADLDADELARPENQNAAALASGADFYISGGRYYVDGELCENEQIVPYSAQPHLPHPQAVNSAGIYFAYLDVWQAHLTALEDDQIREKALNGPDTSTRSKSIWQIRLLRAGNVGDPIACLTSLPAWDAVIAPPTGELAARSQPGVAALDPCIVAADAGFRRLENQLYRVEVHDSGNLGNATFKWSRENGSVVRWDSQNADQITVSTAGRDASLGFNPGDWIELIDEERELSGVPGTLVRLRNVVENVLTLDPGTATDTTDFVDFETNPRVRRWDSPGTLQPVNTDWLDIEDGVQVRLSNGSYHSGDYWMIPARTNTGDVEWPVDPTSGDHLPLGPAGIGHSYCRLAVMEFDGSVWTRIDDCRHLFPPLTELLQMFYVSGDGQEIMPLPAVALVDARTLSVGVAKGRFPVTGARVRFEILSGGGRLQGAVGPADILTVNGLADCQWELDTTTQVQRVRATLLNSIDGIVHLPITFTATLRRASDVAYDPATCPDLASQNANTVQKAIDILCHQSAGVGCTITVGKGGQFATLIDALKALFQANGPDICLCLLPGEHLLQGDIDLLDKEPGRHHLSIAGCGPATRLRLQKHNIRLQQFGSVTLKNIDVFADANAPQVTLDHCGRVHIEGCRISGTVTGGSALVTIGNSRDIVLRDSQFVAFHPNVRDRIGSVWSSTDPLLGKLFEATQLSDFRRGTEVQAQRLARELTPDQRRELSKNLTEVLQTVKASEQLRRGYADLIDRLSAGTTEIERLVDAIDSIRVAHHRERPGLALVLLDAAANTQITNNHILGTVSFYGPPPKSPLTDADVKKLEGLMGDGPDQSILLDTGADLQFRGNDVVRLELGNKVASQIQQLGQPQSPGTVTGLFRNAFLQNCTIENRGSQFASRTVSYNALIFAAPGRDGIPDVLIGDGVVVMACQAFQQTQLDIAARIRNTVEASNLNLKFV